MSKSKVIILLGFSSILVLVSLLIIIGVTNLSKSKLHLDRVVNSNNLKIQLINQMYLSARERTINLQHMLIVNEPIELEKAMDRMGFYGGEFVASRSELLKLNISANEKKILEQQAILSRKVGPIQNQIADLINFGDLKQAQILLIEQAEPLQNAVFKILSQLQVIQREETQSAIRENSDDYKNIVGIMWMVTIIVILICISIVFFTLRLISKNEKQQDKHQQDIEYQAFYDQLTSLPNRRLLNDRMQHVIMNTDRSEVLMAVLFIDCDRFKSINDTLGHTVGDDLLLSIANRLKENVRASDTVCRFSGDEFVIVLGDIEHISTIDRIARKLLDSIAEPHFLEGHKVFTTISMGITVYPIDEKNVNGLLTSADTAMYHVKKNGGNQYEYFNSEMNIRSKQRLTLELDLHEALQNNELEIYYQPLNAISSNRKILGLEALLRWNHPRQGMVLPLDFISIAEDTGLIVAIGEWVLKTACEQTKKWEQQGYGKLGISVNLSPRQFSDSNLVSAVKSALDISGLDPGQLDLEITESTAMHTIDKSIEILHKLKDLGVHISIDDFGTGYSSLSYLQKMPIDTLKIDRSFIKDLHHSLNDKALVQAMVTMAHSLGIKIIAEGVELEEQLVFLSEIDCEIAQGFLFSKPVPSDQLEKLL